MAAFVNENPDRPGYKLLPARSDLRSRGVAAPQSRLLKLDVLGVGGTAALWMDGRMTIYFYSPRDDLYGCLSNFSPHGFGLNGAQWPTVEHYFQAQKFAGTPDVEEIRRAPSPMVAKKMGRSRSRPLRLDWEQARANRRRP